MLDEGTIRVIIGADIVPTSSSEEAFRNASMDELLGAELYEKLLSADIRIFNLEVPLTDLETPIKKCGPNLRAPEATIEGIEKLKPSLLSLANNHIMDQAAQGLVSTMSVLSRKGISYCGAGLTEEEARKPWIQSINGITVGVYSCAEHEFSIAEGEKPGANPIGASDETERVRQLKETCDYVVVLYHGGKEHYRYPSPELQKRCRQYIDSGADFVICQHSHCIGCEEHYQHGLILYGQGNFLFERQDNEYWNTSILLELILSKTECTVNYIPLERCTPGTRIADSKKGEQILSDFASRSEQIKDDQFVAEQYKQFAMDNLESLIRRLDDVSSTFLYRAFNRISGGALDKWYIRKVLLRRKGMSILNTVEDEAWRELLVTALKASMNEK